MHSFFVKLGLAIGGILLSAASFFGSVPTKQLGTSFTPVQTGKTSLSGAGVTANATTVNLTSLLLNDGVTAITMSNFGSIGFATIEPGVPKKEENISFTGITQNANGTAQLTGVTRGLLPVYPYTASTTLGIAHSGGSTLIISNSGAFYNQFAIANNTTTVQANWTFNSSTIPQFSSDTPTSSFTTQTQFIDKGYADALAISGAPNGSPTQKGIFQEATKAQTAAGTTAGSTGADLIVPNSSFNASSSASAVVPISDTNGKLDPNFINTSANQSFTGDQTFASTTATGTSTIKNLKVTGTVTFPGNAIGTTAQNLIDATTTAIDANGAATTTISSTTIPANTFGAIGGLEIKIVMDAIAFNSGTSTLKINYGASSISDIFGSPQLVCGNGGVNCIGIFDIQFLNQASTSLQEGIFTLNLYGLASSSLSIATGTMAVNSTIAQPFSIVLNTKATQNINVDEAIIKKLQL